jgi:hypothetical protein
MYLLFATVIVLMIVLFGSTIFSMIKTYTINSNPKFILGNLWFIGLLIINVLIIIFLYSFYYYKSNVVGKDGPSGDKGFNGYDGNECIIPIPNCDIFEKYNKIK